jgi:hypothetical protein
VYEYSNAWIDMGHDNTLNSAWAHVPPRGLPSHLGDAGRGQLETQLGATARRCCGGCWTVGFAGKGGTGPWTVNPCRERRFPAPGMTIASGHCGAASRMPVPPLRPPSLVREPRRGCHLIPAIAA